MYINKFIVCIYNYAQCTDIRETNTYTCTSYSSCIYFVCLYTDNCTHVRQKRNKVIILYHYIQQVNTPFNTIYCPNADFLLCKRISKQIQCKFKIGILHMFYTILMLDTKFFVFS